MHLNVARVLFVACLGLPSHAVAQWPWIEVGSIVSPFNAYDVSRSLVRLALPSDDPLKFTCDPVAVTHGDRQVGLEVRVSTGVPVGTCAYWQTWVDVGYLAAGKHRVDVTLLRADGSVAAVQSSDIGIEARGTKCNVNPLAHDVSLVLDPPQVEPFMAGKGSDAAWLAKHGNLRLVSSYVDGAGDVRIRGIFDPLADPFIVVDSLKAEPDFRYVLYDAVQVCGFTICPGDTLDDLVEYRATFREQYFYTFDVGEQAALDGGIVPGWQRTGESLRVIRQAGTRRSIENRFHRVYRFWGGSSQAAPAHFFTLSQDECAVLRDRSEWHWTFEGAPFWAHALEGGTCAQGVPLRRMYNAGAGGAPAHRYTTRAAVVLEMTDRGWVDEGAVMCVADQVP